VGSDADELHPRQPLDALVAVHLRKIPTGRAGHRGGGAERKGLSRPSRRRASRHPASPAGSVTSRCFVRLLGARRSGSQRGRGNGSGAQPRRWLERRSGNAGPSERPWTVQPVTHSGIVRDLFRGARQRVADRSVAQKAQRGFLTSPAILEAHDARVERSANRSGDRVDAPPADREPRSANSCERPGYVDRRGKIPARGMPAPTRKRRTRPAGPARREENARRPRERGISVQEK